MRVKDTFFNNLSNSDRLEPPSFQNSYRSPRRPHKIPCFHASFVNLYCSWNNLHLYIHCILALVRYSNSSQSWLALWLVRICIEFILVYVPNQLVSIPDYTYSVLYFSFGLTFSRYNRDRKVLFRAPIHSQCRYNVQQTRTYKIRERKVM